MSSKPRFLWAAAALAVLPLGAQSPPDIQQILQRLDRLEEQNRSLLAEIRELKTQLAAHQPSAPTVPERLEVQESRTAELAQSKVEASQRFPLRLTGTVLFNAFLNSRGSGGAEYPTIASGHEASGGATLRQSILGLDFSGPQALNGARIHGTLRLDLFGGSGQALDQLVRLRVATLSLDWKTRSLAAGIDKPIISPREPESLAQVGVSPLTGAGNLWFWIPQVRFEQDVRLGEQAGLRIQGGVVQTHEVNGSSLSPYAPYGSSGQPGTYTEPARPGGEARLELFAGSTRRIEIASGIHHSVTHSLGASVPSDVYSLDWFLRPFQAVEFTGMAFTGQNVTPLGSPLRQGFIALAPGLLSPVRCRGGWAQLTLRPSPRLWFNLFSGQQDDRDTGLPAGSIGKNLAFGGNVFYRLAPNVLASFEASQTHTHYLAGATVLNNHYDLALAYLF